MTAVVVCSAMPPLYDSVNDAEDGTIPVTDLPEIIDVPTSADHAARSNRLVHIVVAVFATITVVLAMFSVLALNAAEALGSALGNHPTTTGRLWFLLHLFHHDG